MENELKALIRKHGFSFKKAFGQNFLTDEVLLDEIAKSAGVTSDDTVLEIGCGAGALTRALAKKAKRVVGYEIDKTLAPLLSDVLAPFSNVEIVFKDVMKEKVSDIDEKLGKYVLVANLPYYITTPIIMRFLENAKNVKAMVIMVQEEVAERLASKEGTSDYGAVTVAINLRGEAEIVKRVPREMFTPAPNVDSAVVKITVDTNKFAGVNLDNVREVVKAGFGNRRKMLVNNVMSYFKFTRAQAEDVLNVAGVKLTARGEELSSEDFINLTDAIFDIKNEK